MVFSVSDTTQEHRSNSSSPELSTGESVLRVSEHAEMWNLLNVFIRRLFNCGANGNTR